VARTYNEVEAQKILAKAAELELDRRGDTGGVTLEELETAAESAGLDRALVRRAANTLDRPSPGEHEIGRSTDELVSRATARHDNVEVAGRKLFTQMARDLGEAGKTSVVGEGVMWQTKAYGCAYEPGQGRKLALAVFPDDNGSVEVVIRENVTGAGVGGVIGRTLGGGGIGFVIGVILQQLIGAMDEAAFFTILLCVLVCSGLGWAASLRWWQQRRHQLKARQQARVRQLAAAIEHPDQSG